MEIGVNTFGIGRELRKNTPLTLKSLKESGVTSVEPIVNFNQHTKRNKLFQYLDSRHPSFSGIFSIDDAEQRIDAIRSNGLKVESIHLNNIAFDDKSIGEIVGFLKRNNIKYGVFSPLEKNLKTNVDKIEIIHIKDIVSKEKKGKRFCTEAGKGILPLKEILKTTKKYAHLKYILGQDDSISGDALSDIRNGIAFVESVL